MNIRFDGKTVIITGAGKGIGKTAALRFAELGASVAICSRTQSEIEAAAREIEGAGGKALALVTDVADEGQVRAFVERTAEAFGGVDVLVNNAAVLGAPGGYAIDLVDMPFEDFDLVYGINLRGPALFAKYVMPHMMRKKKGAIINVSSDVIRRGMRGRAHYTATKMGVIGLTYSLAWEGAGHGIRTNCIVPGSVATELLDGVQQRLAREEGVTLEEVRARFAAVSPEKRIVSTGEVADLMVYLASDASSGVNGQSLFINAASFMQ